MKIELIKKIKLTHKLVNSVSIVDNSLYYTSSLSNCVSIYNLLDESEEVAVGGTCGYGKYKFREPVHARAFKDKKDVILIVSDWHNHRVVKYKNGRYITELGFYSPSTSRFKNVVKFIKGLSLSGSYIHAHFSDNNVIHDIKTSFFDNFVYFLTSSCRLLNKRYYDINKPNGVSPYKNGLIFTQKNRGRLTLVDLDLNVQKDLIIPELGRLGNVNKSNETVLFCIESIGAIYTLNAEGKFNKIPILPLVIDFKPFSACLINSDLVAVISMSNLHIFNIHTGNESLRYTVNGELHGLDIYKNDIYISDRLNSEVHALRVIND